jgi:hypothetical protein
MIQGLVRLMSNLTFKVLFWHESTMLKQTNTWNVLVVYYQLVTNLRYLFWIQVKNELPSTFKAYRYQQHRWSCGPANLFRKMVMEIIRNKVWLRLLPWIIFNLYKYKLYLLLKLMLQIKFVYMCVHCRKCPCGRRYMSFTASSLLEKS